MAWQCTCNVSTIVTLALRDPHPSLPHHSWGTRTTLHPNTADRYKLNCNDSAAKASANNDRQPDNLNNRLYTFVNNLFYWTLTTTFAMYIILHVSYAYPYTFIYCFCVWFYNITSSRVSEQKKLCLHRRARNSHSKKTTPHCTLWQHYWVVACSCRAINSLLLQHTCGRCEKCLMTQNTQ